MKCKIVIHVFYDIIITTIPCRRYLKLIVKSRESAERAANSFIFTKVKLIIHYNFIV